MVNNQTTFLDHPQTCLKLPKYILPPIQEIVECKCFDVQTWFHENEQFLINEGIATLHLLQAGFNLNESTLSQPPMQAPDKSEEDVTCVH